MQMLKKFSPGKPQTPGFLLLRSVQATLFSSALSALLSTSELTTLLLISKLTDLLL
jgi:hypothetical protein